MDVCINKTGMKIKASITAAIAAIVMVYLISLDLYDDALSCLLIFNSFAIYLIRVSDCKSYINFEILNAFILFPSLAIGIKIEWLTMFLLAKNLILWMYIMVKYFNKMSKSTFFVFILTALGLGLLFNAYLALVVLFFNYKLMKRISAAT